MLLLYNEAQAYAWASKLGPHFFKKNSLLSFCFGGGKVRERGGIFGLFLPDMVSQ